MISLSAGKVPAVLHMIQTPLQVGLYMALFILSEQLVGWLHLPLPANVVGLVLLLGLILCRIVPVSWVRAGSRWLLAEMLLFFVPAVVAVINYSHMLRVDGLRIVSVIVISTLLVLATTAWVVQHVYRYELAREARRQEQI